MTELELRREIRFEPGHTIRQTKGDGRDYGIGAMNILFLLHGPRATIQFRMSTGWVPEKVPVPGYSFFEWFHRAPTGFDLGYHADAPLHEYTTRMEKCPYREAGSCWYDGSGLRADHLLERFMFEGDAAVWAQLEEDYLDQFHIVELTEVRPDPKEITA